MKITRSHPPHRTRGGLSTLMVLFIISSFLLGSFFPLFINPQPAHAAGSIIYVAPDADDTGNGLSWARPYRLQDALANASDGDELWLKQGIYYPDVGAAQTDDDRESPFQLAKGVALYGGFAGDETSRDARDWANNITVLSGDIDQDDTTDSDGIVTDATNISGNNAYHVAIGADNVTLDGLTITAGNADGTGDGTDGISSSYGGGLYHNDGSLTLTNITFSGNTAHSYGGGMYNREFDSASNSTLTNVTFSGNRADSDSGGGMYNHNGNPTLTNVTFSNNSALSGGGLYNSGSPTLTDVEFISNTTTGEGTYYNGGGGMYDDGSATLINVTFSGNSANNYGNGGGMYNRNNPTLTNVTFSGNYAQGYIKHGGITTYSYGGGGIFNLNSNPTLTNVTFNGNMSDQPGGGIFNLNSNPTIKNSIIWGNESNGIANQVVDYSSSTSTYNNSLVEDSSAADLNGSSAQSSDNFDSADPRFVDPVDASSAPITGGDYRLQYDSPLVDMGNNDYLDESTVSLDLNGDGDQDDTIDADVLGNPRIQDGDHDGTATVDPGAYEVPLAIFVDASAMGANDGYGWADAFPNLQDALASATDGDEIWVAAGIYYPDVGNGQTDDAESSTFQLIDGVAIYGGFAGDETSRDARNWLSNRTVLSGDIDGNDTTDAHGVVTDTAKIAGTNATHVVTGTDNALLDGVTITAGQADGASSPDDSGGGMLNDGSSPVLRNISFSGNTAANGGGMANSSSNPTLLNGVFRGNSATSSGGGIFNSSSTPTLTNILLSGNSASNGGGMANDNSSPTLTNVTFSGNQASTSGGGMDNSNSSNPTINNSIFWGNDTDQVASDGSSTPAYTYSLVQDTDLTPSGEGNLDGTDTGNDPRFVAAVAASNAPTTDGDYRLQRTSPLIDMGNNDYLDESTTSLDLNGDGDQGDTIETDLNGILRIQDADFDGTATVDPGANEVPFAVFVDASATGTEDGYSWTNAFTSLQDGLASATDGGEIWVADGVYYPDTGDGQTDDDETSTFQLVNGVTIYGGFAGDETSRDARDWQTNVTVLSGDIDENDTADASGVVTDTAKMAGRNSYHVVTGADNALLDGVTITAGQADGASAPDDSGGGLRNDGSSPTLQNITFSGNTATSGGGMSNSNNSTPLLLNSTFSGNSATGNGGGMHNDSSNPTLLNNTFSGNSATGSGGAIANESSNPTLTNILLSGNSADNGGAIANDSSNPILTNVTVSGNQAATNGGAIDNIGSSPVMKNSMFWGNELSDGTTEQIANDGSSTPTYDYSLVQGVNLTASGTGNLDGSKSVNDPLFATPIAASFAPTTTGDYRLTICSVAIDVGNNDYLIESSVDVDLNGDGDKADTINSDLDNVQRIVRPTVDLGAYESLDTLPTGVDHGTLAFTSAFTGVVEGNSGITEATLATIERTGGNACVVSVQVVPDVATTIVAGEDYTTTATLTTTLPLTATVPVSLTMPFTLTFADGETSKDVMLPIMGDTNYEVNETIQFTLENALGGAILGSQINSTFVITNDDTTAVTITEVPGNSTYHWDGQNEVWEEGIPVSYGDSPTFEFSGPADEGGLLGYECTDLAGEEEEDSDGWIACSSPVEYTDILDPDTELGMGTFYMTFEVRAVASSGAKGAEDSYSWDIVLDIPAVECPVVEVEATTTSDTTPTWTWSSGGSSGVFEYSYKLSTNGDYLVEGTTTTETSYTPAEPLAEGEYTLYVGEYERGSATEIYCISRKTVIVADKFPDKPVVSATTPTSDTTPTWTWESGGGGNGTYRYKLAEDELADGATETTETSYTPAQPLSDGSYTLYVQERDDAGVWSNSGSKTIVIDTTPPGVLEVEGFVDQDNKTMVNWYWRTHVATEDPSCVPDCEPYEPEPGIGIYRYKLNDDDLTSGATITTSNQLTTGPMTEGEHTLYVQERDEAGNWSHSSRSALLGKATVTIVSTTPNSPTVRGTTPTTDTTPTWTWVTGGGGNGTYRYKLNDDDLTSDATETTETSYTPDNPLADGEHTLYVQERNDNDVWSDSGSATIEIVPTIPNSPTVRCTTPTSDTTPTWTWESGGGGNGTYRYKLDNDDLTSDATETTETSYMAAPPLIEGEHTLYVQERNNNGIWSTSGSCTLLVDVTPPSLSWSELIKSTPSRFTRYDIACFLWGILTGSNTCPPITNQSVQVAGVPPIILQTGLMTDTEETEVLSYTCQLDTGTPEPCSSPMVYEDLSVGDHTFTLVASDMARNTTVYSYSWTIDQDKPEVSDIILPDGSNPVSATIFSGKTEPGITVTLGLDLDNDSNADVNYQTVSDEEGYWSIDIANDTPVSGSLPAGGLQEGKYHVIITFTDAAGNETVMDQEVTISGTLKTLYLPLIGKG